MGISCRFKANKTENKISTAFNWGRLLAENPKEVFKLVRNSDVSVSLATVYNTLKAFCDVGLINEVMVDGGKSYFDTRLDDHPHFFWEDTGAISDAPSESLQINNLPNPPNEYEITKVDVIIRLKCSK